jgi:hypothetical protein
MASMGAIYAKQGRPDDALAMFHRGATEAETQQYMSQLFPQGRPNGNGFEAMASAQPPNASGPRTAPPFPSDDRPDVSRMTPEQLGDAMRRERAKAIEKRQQQMMAEIQPPKREGMEDPRANQTSQSGFGPGGQPWVLGGGGNQSAAVTSPNQMPVVTPSGGNPQPPGGSPFGQNPGYGQNPNIAGGQGYGQLTAQPGTNPNIEFWQGAPVQNTNSPVAVATSQGNLSQPSGAGNAWGQQTPTSDPSQFNPPSNRLAISGLQSGLGPDTNIQTASGTSASMAAAQLGMNAGPGGLFPVVNSDGVSQAGFTVPSGPGSDSRFAHEFPAPPQYQVPNQPGRNGLAPGDPRQGSMQNPNVQVAPPSIQGDWGQFGSNRIAQAGGMLPGNDGMASEFNTGANYRGAMANGGDAGSPAAASIPYNGPWPPTNSQPPPQNSAYGNNRAPTPPPMWNRGTANNSPSVKVLGPAPSNSSGGTIEQWPYSRGQ